MIDSRGLGSQGVVEDRRRPFRGSGLGDALNGHPEHAERSAVGLGDDHVDRARQTDGIDPPLAGTLRARLRVTRRSWPRVTARSCPADCRRRPAPPREVVRRRGRRARSAGLWVGRSDATRRGSRRRACRSRTAPGRTSPRGARRSPRCCHRPRAREAGRLFASLGDAHLDLGPVVVDVLDQCFRLEERVARHGEHAVLVDVHARRQLRPCRRLTRRRERPEGSPSGVCRRRSWSERARSPSRRP